MKRTWKYIFSIALLSVTTGVFAQSNDKADSVHSYIPTGIRFGTDIIAIIRTQTDDTYKGWELNADVDFYRYYLAVDYGTSAIKEEITTGSYENDGRYYRFGVDINFLTKDPDRNMFYLGVRYGHSTYDEALISSYADPFYGAVDNSTATTGLKANWAEITTGLRVKMVSGLWLGCTARMKFLPSVSGSSIQQPFEIPGYGLAEKAPWWGFNYQVLWRIPFKKDKSNKDAP